MRVEIKRKNVKINGENPAPLLAGPARAWSHHRLKHLSLVRCHFYLSQSSVCQSVLTSHLSQLTCQCLSGHRGVQNTQDHFMGPYWTKVLPVSVPRISERHVRPQAINAHPGSPPPRSRERPMDRRPNHKTCHTPLRPRSAR